MLWGQEGFDMLYGDDGNDMLGGGRGNDSLAGGAGSDSYYFLRGDGTDLVQENDATAGNTDVLLFSTVFDGREIKHDQIWLQRIANDLIVSVLGEKNDKVTVSHWYLGESRHLDQIKSGNGLTLLDGNVDKLVQAMAAFTPPPPGQFTLPENYRAVLAPVLAASWQGG
jgi:Ca2+-binding RTX toxin-like protein